MHNKEIRIRLATADDIAFIQSLAERFAGVGTPPWRDRAQMWQFHQRSTQEVCDAITNPADLVLLAENLQGMRLGFLYATSATLMERAEGWARECGFRILALDVFALNTHARSFYQHLGYVEETLKLIKEL